LFCRNQKFSLMRYTFLFITSCSIALATIVGCNSVNTSNNDSETTKAFDVHDMDSTAHACDDFYQYAIGSWRSNNPVPETESRWMSFNILEEANRQKVQLILDENAKNTSAKAGTDAQLIRDFYLSALDSLGRQEKGLPIVKTLLVEAEKVKTINDLNAVFASLRPMGVSGPFGFYVGRDDQKSDQYIAHLSQGGLSLPDRDYYLNTDKDFVDKRAKYVAHVNTVFALVGMPNPEAGNIVLGLETKMAEASWDRVKLRDPNLTYNKKETSKYDAELVNIDLKSMLSQLGLSKANELIVGQPSYIKAVDALLKLESIETWKTYLKWKIATSFAGSTTAALEKVDFDFYSTVLSGVDKMKPRSEMVLRTINGQLGEPLGKLFVEKHFPAESKEYMSRMIENLRSAYRDRITALTWMGDDTKVKALKKLESFTYKIGYPDKWKDYSGLSITPNEYLNNLINTAVYRFKMMTDKLGQPIDKDEWFMTPQMVNAYYDKSGNEIVFPAGILQPPFFHPDFDDAINYGGIGAVIGHEFTHGFDDKGSQYDWDGNKNNWWTKADRTAFDALTKALSAQYSSYEPMPGMHINGDMTLGENIADLGGLTLAYAALHKEMAGKAPEPIDGFTWQQRFYLGWANVWKGNIKDDEMKKRLLTDNHSPGQYRVNGTLENIPEFREAFKCKQGNGSMIKRDEDVIRIW
ncbi:MAG: putative endopeptidase, partial [Bacteroidia bacterium]